MGEKDLVGTAGDFLVAIIAYLCYLIGVQDEAPKCATSADYTIYWLMIAVTDPLASLTMDDTVRHSLKFTLAGLPFLFILMKAFLGCSVLGQRVPM